MGEGYEKFQSEGERCGGTEKARVRDGAGSEHGGRGGGGGKEIRREDGEEMSCFEFKILFFYLISIF